MDYAGRANDLIEKFRHAQTFSDAEKVSTIICCNIVLDLISELDIEQQPIFVDGKWIIALEYWEKIIEEVRRIS